jgi:hypothetical protein
MRKRVRTILLGLTHNLLTPILLCILFWWMLNLWCVRWIELLSRVAEAERILLHGGDYFDKAKVFADWAALRGWFDLLFLVLFFAARQLILRRTKSRLSAVLWYVLLANFSTVFCWLQSEDWNNPHVTILGNWLGTPIMLLVVPSVVFGLDLWAPRFLAISFAPRTAIEIVLILVWSWVWALTSLFVLDLMWL